MKNINVIKQVAILPEMTTDELKQMWKKYHKTTPPPFNRVFLIKRLAYRIQELAYGGLSKETEQRLDGLVSDEDGQSSKMPAKEQVLPGTRLVRGWKGVEHSCTVLDDGFEYQGRRFKSLTAVANFITGSRWNGLVFFGLKKQGRGGKS